MTDTPPRARAVSQTAETAAARVLAVLRAWEHRSARGWTARGSWALIQGDEDFDPAATDTADPEYQGLVALFTDGSRLTKGAEGWRIGRCHST